MEMMMNGEDSSMIECTQKTEEDEVVTQKKAKNRVFLP